MKIIIVGRGEALDQTAPGQVYVVHDGGMIQRVCKGGVVRDVENDL